MQKVVFFATSDIALPSLEGLVSSGYEVLVVTQPDRPVGRHQELHPSPVKVRTQALGLEVLQPEKPRQVIDRLTEFGASLGVVVAYGVIISNDVLGLFSDGVLNIHPSLLPKYRGPSPIQTAVANQDAVTGVTLMVLDAEMDHGPIVVQHEMEIGPNDTAPALLEKAGRLGAELLLTTLPDYLAGKAPAIPQDHRKATFTKMLTRDDGRIDWSWAADKMYAHFRAYQPWPGLFTTWQGKRLKIIKFSVLEGDSVATTAPGTVFEAPGGYPAAACGKGAVLLEQLQIEGKTAVSGKEFVVGHSGFLGTSLTY